MATSPSIASVEDLRVVSFQGRRLKIGTGLKDHLSEGDAETFILRAEGLFYGFVKKLYQVPFTAPTDSSSDEAKQEWELVKRIIVDLTCVDIFSYVFSSLPNITEPLERIEKRAMDLLKALCNSNATLRLPLTEQELVDPDGYEGHIPTSQVVEKFGQEPYENMIEFSADGTGPDYNVWLDYTNIVSNSEVLKDETRETTYVRGTDYEMNYELGYVWRLADGAIPADTTILVSGKHYKGVIFSKVMPELFGERPNYHYRGTSYEYV